MTDESGDLLVLGISGVQRWIEDSRSTADLRSSSEIVASLASAAAEACAGAGGRLVFPAERGGAGPNRIVALTPVGDGARVAEASARAVREAWRQHVVAALGKDGATPGFPAVQWAVADAAGSYAERWEAAHRALTARKRTRDFAPVAERERLLCSLSPQWIAADPPAGLREHERDVLAAANWVARRWPAVRGGDRTGFPSTPSIASATFRSAVLDRLTEPGVRTAVERLRSVVRELDRPRETPVSRLRRDGDPERWFAAAAGPWVYPEAWQAEVLDREVAGSGVHAAVGGAAARALIAAMKPAGTPTSYLALLAQDVDGMGGFLGGSVPDLADRTLAISAAEHRRVSRLLADLEGEQRRAVEDLLGVPVYAGGDDLLALLPAASALAAAQRLHDLMPAELPPVSTAVLFFHRRSSLRLALHEVRALLHQAKRPDSGKHGLAVGFLRRSGTRETTVQPWSPVDGDPTTRLLSVFLRSGAGRLSPGLVADLIRDDTELSTLDDPYYAGELGRLAARHGGGPGDGEALAALGRRERAGTGPVPAARLGVFLRQECR